MIEPHGAGADARETVVQLPAEKGADASRKGTGRWTGLRGAAVLRNETAIRQLLKHERKAAVRLLRENGFKVTAKFDQAEALHWAIKNGHESAVQLGMGIDGRRYTGQRQRGMRL
jgi:hypothetical protein